MGSSNTAWARTIRSGTRGRRRKQIHSAAYTRGDADRDCAMEWRQEDALQRDYCTQQAVTPTPNHRTRTCHRRMRTAPKRNKKMQVAVIPVII